MNMPRIEIVQDKAVVDGSSAQYVPTAHVGGRIEPTLFILHDTAGGPPGDSVSWLARNPNSVSAHVIVKLDGSIVQLAPFDRRTNHAGASQWRGRSGCNGWSIGIEIVNPGQLRGTPERPCPASAAPILVPKPRRQRSGTSPDCGCPTPRRSSPPSRRWCRRWVVPTRPSSRWWGTIMSRRAARWIRHR
jgi:hypothetical protein